MGNRICNVTKWDFFINWTRFCDTYEIELKLRKLFKAIGRLETMHYQWRPEFYLSSSKVISFNPYSVNGTKNAAKNIKEKAYVLIPCFSLKYELNVRLHKCCCVGNTKEAYFQQIYIFCNMLALEFMLYFNCLQHEEFIYCMLLMLSILKNVKRLLIRNNA